MCIYIYIYRFCYCASVALVCGCGSCRIKVVILGLRLGLQRTFADARMKTQHSPPQGFLCVSHLEIGHHYGTS